MNETVAVWLEVLKDCRGEIEMRIRQRDNFAMQLIIAVGVVLTAGLHGVQYSYYLIPFFIPVISYYYSCQILYSYVMHDRLHEYIAFIVEPQIKRVANLDPEVRLWERQCEETALRRVQRDPGIRRAFFEQVPWVAAFFSMVLFCIAIEGHGGIGMHFYYGALKIRIATWASLFFCIIIGALWRLRSLKRFQRLEIKTPGYYGEEDELNPELKPLVGLRQSAQKRVIFIDRDGTLHRDAVNTHRLEDLELLEGVVEGLRKLQEKGFYFIIVSNQDGIKRGLYGREEMHSFNMHLLSTLRKEGIEYIETIYYSPHKREEDHPSFKPNCGMFLKAKQAYQLVLEKTYMIGDQNSDMVAAISAGVQPVFVETGIYAPEHVRLKAHNGISIPWFSDFLSAATWICENCEQNKR